MKNQFFKSAVFFLFVCLITSKSATAQVGIGTTNPDASSMLDIQSNNKGVLIPRMTTTQRNAIASPATGLMVYNTTTNTEDVYNGSWKSLGFSANPNSNLVYVYSLADLPTPASAAITLDDTKMYIFSGAVNISPNYIIINGAGLKGNDPQKDMIISNVSGAVLRSTNKSIFIQDLAIVPYSANTKAYDVSDSTKLFYFNSFSGSSVVEIPGVPSLGVGQISGFKAITILKNFWKVSDGVKITGNVGKFTAVLNFIEDIATGGSGVEFLAAANINDIDMANNYFIYTGQTGIKVVAGAVVDRGRMTTNMFRGVMTPLVGVDSYTNGWSMKQNTNIPDSRAFSFIYFANNATVTTFPAFVANTFYKIQGATTMVSQKRFTAGNNIITYNDVEPITAKVSVVISAKAPGNNSDYSICIGKNGSTIALPIASMAAATNNQSFQIILNTEVNLITGDYIEVFISRNTSGTGNITVDELQFRVTD